MEDKEMINKLCRRVEETSGMQIDKSKDFERLVVNIYDRTGTLLSPTTLKRIWGYVKENTVTRRSTLDFLAQYCGWNSYDEFLRGEKPEIESGFVNVKVLNAESDLKKGNVLRLMWHPSRVCDIRYLGDSVWEVVHSEGTRLVAGDMFKCSVIMSGEPLYLDSVMHAGEEKGVYVCGRRNGVHFTIKHN